MATLKIDINPIQIREIEFMFAGLGNSAVKVLTRAINKTLTGVRTDMTEEAYQELNTTKTTIRSGINIKRATWTKISGVTSRTGTPLPLAKFTGTAQRASGVSVKVLRTGKRSIIKHTFLAKMKSGHLGVFWREEKVGTATLRWTTEKSKWFATLPREAGGMGKFRLPIMERFGPRIEDILAKANRWKNIEVKGNERMLKNMDAEIKYELSRL